MYALVLSILMTDSDADALAALAFARARATPAVPHADHPPAAKKTPRPDGLGHCSDACSCGCSDGKSCQCGAPTNRTTQPAPRAVAPLPSRATSFLSSERAAGRTAAVRVAAPSQC